jgi:flagellar hook-associated protein 2
MASNPISSIGVGSGLPLNDLLNSLRQNENAALQVIQTQQVSAQNKLSAYGKVKSALSALQTAAQALDGSGVLDDDTPYNALTTNVTGDALAASTSDKAVAGEFSITVDQLAKAQTLVTSGIATRDQANGSGGGITITLSDGTSKTLDLSGKDTSLDGLISAINDDPDLGVSATLINDGSDTPYHLMLTANDTGTDAAVASISSTNGAIQDILGFTQGTPSANITEGAAANSIIHVNGLEVTGQSNHLQDAIEGVTLDLKKVDTDPVTVSISHDDTAVSKAVHDFVDAYNGVQSTIASLTSYDADTNKGSVLSGDSLARKVQNEVRDVLNQSLSSGNVRTLNQLGITTNPEDGSLVIDDDKLAAAIHDHPGDVEKFLGGATGIGKTMDTLTSNMLATGGLISSASDGMNQTLDDLTAQYQQTSDRIDARMETYRKQFTSLDTLVAQMNSVSSYLTQQLSHLGTQSNSSK